MDNIIKKIESLLQVKLEKYDYEEHQPLHYYLERKGEIENLKLDGVVLNGEIIDELLPYLQKLRQFKLSNARVSNISELLKLEVWSLHLEQVIFENDFYQEEILKNLTLDVLPGEVHIKNTPFNVEALRGFDRVKFLFLEQCQLSNAYELCDLPNLYQLELTGITFGETKSYIEKDSPRNSRLLLTLTDCLIEDLHFFMPFATNLWNLSLVNSTVGGIEAIRQFPKMDVFNIDDKSVITSSNRGFVGDEIKASKLPYIRCEVKTNNQLCDLEKLAPIADYFTELSFNDCQTTALLGISKFKKVSRLRFENCIVDLQGFLSIALQIDAFYFVDSTMKNTGLWSHFTEVSTIKNNSFDDDKEGISGLESFKPLVHQLKRLSIFESLEQGNSIKDITQFTSLEVLEINVETIEEAEAIVSMSSLKKLKLSNYIEEAYTLDLQQLTKLQYLSLEEIDQAEFKGFEALTNLEVLEISGGDVNSSYVDINQLPSMPSLKRLAFDTDDYEVKGLAHFPNLEELKITGAKSIELNNLHQLKVLDLSNNINVDKLDCFDDLPQLEQLGLAEMYCKNSHEIVQLHRLKKLRKLKWLSLMETQLSTLEGIEELTQLEYLDLYETDITDITRLNQLQHLKEVNLATKNSITRFEMLAQLDNTDFAIFMGLPFVQFRVWDDVELWENYY